MTDSNLNLLIAASGAAILLFTFASRILRRFSTLPLIAFGIGIVLGPAGLSVLSIPQMPAGHFELEQIARISLAFGLTGVALRFDRKWLRNWLRPGLLLLIGAMLAMWVIGAGLASLLFATPPALSLLIGAIVTPTDPIVASAVVSGPMAQRNIPERLRLLLSFESGANDGLAYLLVMLPTLLLTHPQTAFTDWLSRTLLWEVLGSALIAAAAGYLLGRLLSITERQHASNSTYVLVGALGVALVLVGSLKLLHTDSILAVFVGCLVFALQLPAETRERLREFAEATSKLALTPMFLLFAVRLPWDEWATAGVPIVLFALGILLLRRLPALWVLLGHVRGTGQVRDRLFLGWFGPIGVSSMFYMLLADRHVEDPRVLVIASAAISASIVAHGLSTGPLVQLYGRTARESAPSEPAG